MGKLKTNKLEKSIEKGIDKIATTSTKNIKKITKKITNPILFRKKKIGLVLGSGSAKGFAHIGVLKVLEKNNIPIDMIAGTSMGAMIGALYLVKKNAKDVEIEAKNFELRKALDLHLPKVSLIRGKKLDKFLHETLENKKFSDLDKKLFITATDLKNNQLVIFDRGDITKAVRASLSIPGILEPVENNGRILIDGAWKDPVPTRVLRDAGCDVIIAVNLNSLKSKEPVYEKAITKKKFVRLPNILKVLLGSTEIYENDIITLKDNIDDVDVLIEPKVYGSDSYDFNHVKKFIKKGETAANKKIKKIKRIVKRSLI